MHAVWDACAGAVLGRCRFGEVPFWGVTLRAYFCILTVRCRGKAAWGAGADGAAGRSLWGAV